MMKKLIIILCMFLLLISCGPSSDEALENEVDKLEKENETQEVLLKELEVALKEVEETLETSTNTYKTRLQEHHDVSVLQEETILKLQREIDDLKEEIKEFSTNKDQENFLKILYDYEHFEENYKPFTREALDALMLLSDQAYDIELAYTEIGHAQADYNREDPIHKDSVFEEALKHYHLVTEFESYEAMFEFYNKWFSKSYVESLMASTVGSIDDHKHYVLYKDKLFVQIGEAGDTSIATDIDKCKYKIQESKENEFTMDVFYFNVANPFAYDTEIQEMQLTFVLEENGWRLNSEVGRTP